MQTSSVQKLPAAAAEGLPTSWTARSGVRETGADRAPAPHAVHYPMLDWIRGVVALIIGLQHQGVLAARAPVQFSLDILFVLSGWLIGRILLDTRPDELPRFYFRRVTRIWIPYFVAFALIMALSVLRDPITPRYLEVVFYDLTFVYNWFGPPMLAEHVVEMPLQGTANHFWSICFEEQFYLLAPLVLTLVPPRIGRSPLLWAASFVAMIVAGTHGGIALGVLAAILCARHGDVHLRPAVRALLAAIAVACAAGVVLDRMHALLGSALFALAVVLLLARTGPKSRWGSIVSGVSYPFYLSAWVGTFAAHWIMGRFGLRESAITDVLELVLNVAFCTGLYWLVDRQVLARRERWYTRRRGVLAAVSGYVLVAIGFAGAAVLHALR